MDTRMSLGKKAVTGLLMLAMGGSVMVALVGTGALVAGCTVVSPAIKKQTILVDCKLIEYVKRDPLLTASQRSLWLDVAEMHSNLVFGAPQACDPAIFPEVK